MAQSFESHAHHPVLTYVAGLFWLAALILLAGYGLLGWSTFGVAVACLTFSVLPLITASRAYTTTLQDRIIRLEMKVRCAELLPAGEDAKLDALSPKQIAALRFASDGELGPLLDRAVRERLAPRDIKQLIVSWRPDLHRT